MRVLSTISNVDAPTTDYPKGRIRNKNNAVAPPVVGSPVVEEMYGDIIQFFHKCVAGSGVVENDLPDNETNGYQLIEAVLKYFTSGLRTKIINIGDWNMDTDAIKIVNISSLSLNPSQIRGIDVIIINDTGDKISPLNSISNSTSDADGGIITQTISNTEIYLQRRPGGSYDGSSEYNATSYNRGWITIKYMP